METWRNWSGSATASPNAVHCPSSIKELTDIVSQASKVRVTGASHSFMPICATNDTLIDLSEFVYDPLTFNTDKNNRTTVWAPAGWSLKILTEQLHLNGYALQNQGDINVQSLAGVISTGTHGTGNAFGSLSTLARGFKIVTADGEQLHCDAEQNSEVFQAARLSLGMLGVITHILIDVVPSYYLQESITVVDKNTLFAEFPSIANDARNAEFFLFPYANAAYLKVLQEVPAVDFSGQEEDDGFFEFTCKTTAKLPFLAPHLQRLMVKLSKPFHREGPAHLIFPNERNIRFEEMEYHFPKGAGLKALDAALQTIHKNKWPIAFPFEFRTVASDDIWLSPFNHGASESLAFHQYSPMPWKDAFSQIEAIFRQFDGRPHWAKRNTLSRNDVDAYYPKAADFRKIRANLDPNGKFLNEYLAPLFGNK